jgi:PAS domain S-box-containing protein
MISHEKTSEKASTQELWIIPSIVGFGILLIALILLSLRVQQGLGAFIFGEGVWSKAQKDAVISLISYMDTGHEEDYQKFLNDGLIQQNNHLARIELQKPRPDFQLAQNYLILGGNHAEDVSTMSYLFYYGDTVEFIKKSAKIWEKGDELFAQLRTMGESIRELHKKGSFDSQVEVRLSGEINRLGVALNAAEKEFSETLNHGARWLRTILEVMNALSFILFFGTGLLLFVRFKKVQTNLVEERNRFNFLMGGLNQATIVSIADQSGTIVFANENFCRISGYSLNELMGQDHRIVNSGLHSKLFFQEMWKTLCAGSPWSGEICNKRKDGTLYWVDSSIVPIVTRSRETHFLSVRFDITERKNMERQLSESTKLASLGEMSAGVAHEINNPLAIVDGKVSQILRVLGDDSPNLEQVRGSLQIIKKSVARISKIVKGLKRFSRDAKEDPLEVCDLSEIVSDTLSLCGERFKVHGVELRVTPDIDTKVRCRPTQISQVLLNLLNNAFDAVRDLSEKWVDLSIVVAGQKVQVRVTDSGAGIDPEVAAKMMEPFFTTKKVGQGTGLGLSISKGIIEGHQGRLFCEPSSKNTRMVIELPI